MPSTFRLLSFVAVLAASAIALWVFWRRAPPIAPDAGVPLAVARERAARISSLRYDAAFHIPSVRTEPVRGTLAVSFSLVDPSRPLAVDFAQSTDRLVSVVSNGRILPPLVERGHIMIPSRALRAGPNSIRFEFLAGDAPLNRNDEFMYTLFVPARASLGMPCFDQPDLKARWTLSLDVPSGWAAVANGAETTRTAAAGRVALTFAETQPLPTYLFAFAAGRFSIETAQRDGRQFRMFHRETDTSKLARNREAIFDLHARAIAWLENYTGIAYPFGKFDFVLIPSFQFGGMEHAGAIFYNAAGLLLDESATQNQLLGRANVISHETSHMWFGDLVTMRWFNDVWMKEVFANLMASKIVNPSFPSVNHDLRFLFQNHPAAYDVDRTAGANPIRQELANLNEASSLYGAIIYQKAPIVMRQLERLLGPDTFRDGLRDYLGRFSFGNATWTDLVEILDNRTPADLAAWSRAWVDEPGRPTIRMVLQTSGGRVQSLVLAEEDPRRRALFWPEALQIVLGGPGRTERIDVTLSEPEMEVSAAANRQLPRWILPAGGYGRFDLDLATLEYLSTSLRKIEDPYLRGTALVLLWEEMLEGRVPPGRIFDDLLAALPAESDELATQQLLEYVRVAFWRFTPADDRPAVAARLETVLRAGLASAQTTSRKSAWFGAFRNTVLTPDGIDWLAKVWRREIAIDGLPLSEPDEADIAADLALRDVADAADILQIQLGRFKNDDRKARFAFILPALSGDADARAAWFGSLKDVRNRQHEAWVLDGARYLHHPLRAAASKKLIRPALDLLLEIQRTGDIFFPKRWADATLSGYQSVQTAAEVRAFIDQLPSEYPPRLKWVLQASADQLLRAARLLSQ